MTQIEPVGYLPPSKELLLEIQVSDFIKDFLFSGAEDCTRVPSSSLLMVDKTIPANSHLVVQRCGHEGYGSLGQEENSPISDIYQHEGALSIPVPSQGSIWTDKISSARQSPPALGRSGSGRFSDNSTSTGQISIKVDEQWDKGPEARTPNNASWMHAGKWIETALRRAPTDNEDGTNTVSKAVAVNEREGKTMDDTQLCRTETFPCNSKTQRERLFNRNDSSGASDAGIEIKHSCRKPPRPPPRSTRQPPDRKDRPRLPRCASDTNLLLQSCRKTKMERRRKMAAGSSTSSATHFWALIFTLCFAVAMILQGVSSQSSRILVIKSISASSPAASNKSPPMETNLAASSSKGSPSEAVPANSVFDFSIWAKEGDSDDVGRESTIQVFPILKGFDFQSSGISIS